MNTNAIGDFYNIKNEHKTYKQHKETNFKKNTLVYESNQIIQDKKYLSKFFIPGELYRLNDLHTNENKPFIFLNFEKSDPHDCIIFNELAGFSFKDRSRVFEIEDEWGKRTAAITNIIYANFLDGKEKIVIRFYLPCQYYEQKTYPQPVPYKQYEVFDNTHNYHSPRYKFNYRQNTWEYGAVEYKEFNEMYKNIEDWKNNVQDYKSELISKITHNLDTSEERYVDTLNMFHFIL